MLHDSCSCSEQLDLSPFLGILLSVRTFERQMQNGFLVIWTLHKNVKQHVVSKCLNVLKSVVQVLSAAAHVIEDKSSVLMHALVTMVLETFRSLRLSFLLDCPFGCKECKNPICKQKLALIIYNLPSIANIQFKPMLYDFQGTSYLARLRLILFSL